MDVVALIGRIVFSVMFLSSGINHITKRQYMAEYASSMGVPAARVILPLSGGVLLAGGTSVLLGVWGDLGALALLLFLVPTAIYMHGFWKFEDAQMKQQQQAHFMKNMTMAGGALITLAWFMCSSGLSITGPLFG